MRSKIFELEGRAFAMSRSASGSINPDGSASQACDSKTDDGSESLVSRSRPESSIGCLPGSESGKVATRKIDELASSLYLVSCPCVVVCETCAVMVKSPVGHLSGPSHRVKNPVVLSFVEEKLSGVHLDNDWMNWPHGAIDALPFIPVQDGWKCLACGKWVFFRVFFRVF